MADYSVEKFQRNQSIQISKDIIGQSEEHEQKMQINAQRLWDNAHIQLVAILRFLDQEYDESCEKAHRPLRSFTDDDLAYLILVRLRTLKSEASKKDDPEEIIETKRNLDDLSKKYSDLEQELLAVKELNKKLLAEKSALETHLSVLQQVQKEISPLENKSPDLVAKDPGVLLSIPEWIKAWKESRFFDKTSTAILVMGEKGIALRPTIIGVMAKRLSLSEANKNLDEALNWLIDKENTTCPVLIEQVESAAAQGSSSGGNQPSVLHLTQDGQIAYQFLSGKLPEDNEFDMLLKHHSSPEHTILNIQAGEILEDEGYQIRGRAQSINLSNGETYIPDIIAANSKTGEVIFVEVERDVNKDQISRKQKWMKFYEASNGNLYVFCDNLNCQRAIQGEINFALSGLAYNSFLTNLHGVRSGKRSEKDCSIWLSQRKGK